MRRILFLAHHFPPVGGGGVQRALKFVRYLPDFGYEPVVVTGPGDAFALWTPEDRTLSVEVPPEIDVRRLSGPEPPPSAGWRRRAERLLDRRSSFDRWWVEGTIAAGREAGDVDLVFGELVPYVTAEAASALAGELRKPWVADLQDPWALDEMWQYPTAVHRLRDLGRMRRLLRTAAAVVMNTPEAALRVKRRVPELSRSTVVSIPNGFDEADFAGAPQPRHDGTFRIVHSGYLHTDLGLRHRRTRRVRRLLGGMPVPEVDLLTRSHVYLLEAIDRLIAAEPGLRSTIELHLVGVLSDADRAAAAHSPVVRMHGYRPHAETVALLRSADLLFLPMHDLPEGVRAGLVPGKTYEYLASGRPILAAVPDGDARELLTKAGNALLCRPGDTDGMARALAEAIARWRAGEPATPPRADVVARYERRRQTGDLARIFDLVLAARADAPGAAAVTLPAEAAWPR